MSVAQDKNKSSSRRSNVLVRAKARSDYFGYAVVVGLIVEVILAFAFREHKSWLANWGPVFADALVAIGVYGEIHFAGRASVEEDRLRLAAEERIALAEQRAAASLLVAEQERSSRVLLEAQIGIRTVTESQYRSIRDLRHLLKTVIIIRSEDNEAQRYAQQLGRMFRLADIVVVHSGMVQMAWRRGVTVIQDPNCAAESRALFDCMTDAEFSGVNAIARSDAFLDHEPAGMPIIVVGAKPVSPGDWPPEVWRRRAENT